MSGLISFGGGLCLSQGIVGVAGGKFQPWFVSWRVGR